MVLLLIIAFAAVVFFEVPGLIRKQYWRELAAFSVLLIFGFMLSLMLVLGVSIPPVSAAITNFIKALFGL